MDEERETNQDLYESIAEEYNKANLAGYGLQAFPNIEKGRSLPPSPFQPILWNRSKEVLTNICNEYDFYFKYWKKLEFHEGFPVPDNITDMTLEAKLPFENFAKKHA